MKQGFLVPVYKHGASACSLAKRLSAFGLPIIMVDDGNDSETKTLLEKCASDIPAVALVRIEKNSGKGGAVTGGLRKASELGLTHVLQIDADGQHDAGMAAFFLEESAKHPDMIICGYPEFDATAPKHRVIGRKISNFWASVVTLSTELREVLCGFRVYPVAAAVRAAGHLFIDKRMGFDPEIMVRLYWNKVYPVYHPIKVSYPPDGVSNFHAVRDNLRLCWTFSRLFVGMILRLPLLVIRNVKRRRKRK